MVEFVGAQQYLNLYAEATWGTKPGTPTYLFMPVQAFDAMLQPENRKARPFVGLFQEKHASNFRGAVSGPLTAFLHGWHSGGKSLAEHLIDWAFDDPESTYLSSKGAEWAEGPNVSNKQLDGLRVNAATLQGSDDSGVIECNLDLMGKNEVTLATAQALPADMEGITHFEFGDSTLTIDTVATPFQAFSLQRQNGLKPYYLGQRRPQLLPRTTNVSLFNFTIPKDSAAYDNFRRLSDGSAKDFDIQLKIKGLHNGTGAVSTNYAAGTADMPKARFVSLTEAGGLEDLKMVSVQCVCLKPDSAENAVQWTWGDEA